MRSNATILVSYSCRRSAAWASASKAAGFILLNPNADQLARENRAAWRAHKGSPQQLYSCTTCRLKLDAVRTLLSGHGFHLSKAQNTCQITNFNLSGSRGRTPKQQTSNEPRAPGPLLRHEATLRVRKIPPLAQGG